MDIGPMVLWLVGSQGHKLVILIFNDCLICRCRYVLLKERNVLLTEEYECKRSRVTLPAPHRKTLVSAMTPEFILIHVKGIEREGCVS